MIKYIITGLVSATVAAVITLQVVKQPLVENQIPPAKLAPHSEKQQFRSVATPPTIVDTAPRRYTSKEGHMLLYDNEGRLISKTTAKGDTELITYDRNGEILKIDRQNNN